MKTGASLRERLKAAFGILAVIGLICVLVVMVLPFWADPGYPSNSPVAMARTEVQALANAIEAYQSAYGHFPVSPEVRDWSMAKGRDFTFGGDFINGSFPPYFGSHLFGGRILNNAEVIAVVMDLTNYPGGGPTINTNHALNPRQTKFLNANFSHPVNAGSKSLPGVDQDGVYRDPWGNPYLITVDLNGDGKADDFFYGFASVSQSPSGSTNDPVGLNGLIRTNFYSAANIHYLFPGRVMVWSAGPDGRFDSRLPANVGVNQDNVLSWH